MTDRCPECGAEAVFAERNARVLHGSCAGCGGTFTIVRDESPSGASSGPATGSATDGPGAPAAVSPVPSPSCADCGGPLAVKNSSATSLVATCDSCATSLTYVLAPSRAEAPDARYAARPRAPRGEAGRFGTPRARPCRECGGPLRFSTDENGNVTGECGSCGNRFTLPPRREPKGGREERGFRRDRGRGFTPSYRRPGAWPRQAGGDRPRRFGSSGPPFRRKGRRPPAEDDDEENDRRRRGRRGD